LSHGIHDEERGTTMAPIVASAKMVAAMPRRPPTRAASFPKGLARATARMMAQTIGRMNGWKISRHHSATTATAVNRMATSTDMSRIRFFCAAGYVDSMSFSSLC